MKRPCVNTTLLAAAALLGAAGGVFANPSAQATARSLRPERATDASAAQIIDVVAAQAPAGVTVTLRANGRLVPSGIATSQRAPHQITIELPGVAPGRRTLARVARGPVRQVRLEGQPGGAPFTRVVIDLSQPASYRVAPRPADQRELTLVVAAAPRAPLATGARPSRAAPARAVLPAAMAPLVSRRVLVSAELAPAAPIATPLPMEPEPSIEPPAEPPPVQPVFAMVRSAARQRLRGRMSLYANQSHVTVPGRAPSSATELVTAASLQLSERDDDGVEFALDVRHSRFTAAGREPRLSIYDGFVGARLADGGVRVRAGQMWVNDLGALGSVAGGLIEIRGLQDTEQVRLRGVVFGGVEPLAYELGYAPHVRKYGGLLALETNGVRRHVVGYVQVRNASVTERSVVSVTNFLPVGGRFFLYQTAEYDVQPPAGHGRPGLNYFFTNARISAGSRVDLQLTANRGRSLDLRALSDDVLAGRPLTQRSLDGLMYQSLGGRVTVEVVRGARLYAGYSQDRNNRDDRPTGRALAGAFLSNVAGSGLDVVVSDNLIERSTGNHHSRYLSVGRQAGHHVYLSGEYSTSLSVIRFVRTDGFVVELRPETRRYGGSAVVTLGRTVSLLATGDYTLDGDVRDLRVTSGLTYRLR